MPAKKTHRLKLDNCTVCGKNPVNWGMEIDNSSPTCQRCVSNCDKGVRIKPLDPSPAEIKAAREDAGLTQREAAALLHSTIRAWQQWEAGDRRMHLAFWELFRLKTGKK